MLTLNHSFEIFKRSELSSKRLPESIPVDLHAYLLKAFYSLIVLSWAQGRYRNDNIVDEVHSTNIFEWAPMSGLASVPELHIVRT